MSTETTNETPSERSIENVVGASDSLQERLLLWVDKHFKWLLTLPTVFILFALTFYPLLRAVRMSLYYYLPTGDRIFTGLGNYASLLSDSAFHHSLIVTAKFVLIAVSTEFALGFGIALLLNKKIKVRGLWQTLILVPMILSPTVIGLIWRLMYAPNGLLDYVFQPILGHNVGWISEPSLALYSVIVTDIWQWTPLVVLVLFAGLQSVPDHIREAAIMDGASRTQRFIDITLPYLRSVIVLVLIIRLVDAIRVFAKVYILTRGGPASATNIISMMMYRTAFQFGNYGQAAAMGVTLLAVVTVLAIGFVKVAKVEF